MSLWNKKEDTSKKKEAPCYFRPLKRKKKEQKPHNKGLSSGSFEEEGQTTKSQSTSDAGSQLFKKGN